MEGLGLRALLWVLAGYHLAIGLVALLSHVATARVLRAIYGIGLDSSPQLRYAVRMLGAYAVAFGALLALAARDPGSHTPVIAAAVFLLGTRAACRIAFADLVTRAFQVGTRRNLAHAALLLAEAALLVWWLAE